MKANKTPRTATSFFSHIEETTELGSAIVMVTYGNERSAPVGLAINLREAREIAASHREMLKKTHKVTPLGYDLWAAGPEGFVRLPQPIA